MNNEFKIGTHVVFKPNDLDEYPITAIGQIVSLDDGDGDLIVTYEKGWEIDREDVAEQNVDPRYLGYRGCHIGKSDVITILFKPDEQQTDPDWDTAARDAIERRKQLNGYSSERA